MDRTKINSLTVFCGAREGLTPNYGATAFEVGKWMAKQGLQLVYGGGRLGLMGALAQGCFQNGGRVVGVIPESLMEKELAFTQAQELIIVKTMHERKAIMAERADAFLALPGGFGTLDEIFEIITWRQLGFHEKPIWFLNENGYYDKLFEFSKWMAAEGFVSEKDLQRIQILSSVKEWSLS